MRFSITEKLPNEASVSTFYHFVNLLISSRSTKRNAPKNTAVANIPQKYA